MNDESLTQVLPEHKGLALIITKSYKKDMSAEALYEATRGVWKSVPKDDSSFVYAYATYKGIVKEVYEIELWEKAGTKPYTMVSHADTNLTNRWEFVGHVAPESVRNLYIGKKIVRSYGSSFKKVGG